MSSESTSPSLATRIGKVFLLILLSPFLLLGAIFLCLSWLLLLPFRSCVHGHPAQSRIKPTHKDFTVQSESPLAQTEGGDWFQSPHSGLWIFHRSYLPAAASGYTGNNPRAVLYFAHGMSEYHSRSGYFNLMEKLLELGFRVEALDHAGHGFSTGERVYFSDIHQLIDDFIHFWHLKNLQISSSVPRFIMGNSMGGLITMSAALKETTEEYANKYHSPWQLNGVILTAPALAVDKELATPTLIFLAKLLAAIFPKLALKGIEPHLLCRSKEVNDMSQKDTMIFRGGARTRVGEQMLKQIDVVTDNLHRFTKPILLCHGTADKVCPPAASQIVYEKVSSKDKTLFELEDFYHDVYQDPERDKFVNEVVSWLLKQSEAARNAADVKIADTDVTIDLTGRSDVAKTVSPVNTVRFHMNEEDAEQKEESLQSY